MGTEALLFAVGQLKAVRKLFNEMFSEPERHR